MKKLLALLLALGLAMPLVVDAKAKKLDILKDEGFHTEDYSKLTLAWMSSKEYLKTIKENKNYEDTRDAIDDIEMGIKPYIERYCKEDFEGGKKGKELKMTVNLVEYKHGSRAAAAFVGFGAGSGHIVYEVHLWDGQKDVASFEIRAGITRMNQGWGASPAGANVAKGLVKSIRTFFDQH